MHRRNCESLWVNGCSNSLWDLGKSTRMVKQHTKLNENRDNDTKDDNYKANLNLAGLLKACAKKKNLREGIMLHADIQKKGLLKNNLYLASSLINMYAICGKLAKAQQLLEDLPIRDVVTWSALIAGYAKHGQGWEALNCFEQMQNEGISPDTVTYICILKACSCIGAIDRGIKIHREIMNRGLLNKDMMLGTALVDMYAKCGLLGKARHVLEGLPVRDVVAWSALTVGYAQQGQGREALKCFKQMRDEGLSPDSFTFSCILKACGDTRELKLGKSIHEEIVCRHMLDNNIVLGNALVGMYAKCGVLTMSLEVFNELLVRDVVSWNALIAAYTEQGRGDEALISFERMKNEGLSPNTVTLICAVTACSATRSIHKGVRIHQQFVSRNLMEKDILLGTALVDMYAKCDELEKAHQLLEYLPLRNVVSWSALISGYAQQGQGHGALDCLEWMKREGFSPNAITFTCILKACASMGAIDKGKRIHNEIVNRGLLENDVLLGNALVDLYAKCGLLRKAQQVLEELPVRDVASWNALIAGYALQGHGHEALNCLQKMQHDGLSPNSITFLSVLSACSHRGLLDEARAVYMGMTQKHGITASVGHHTCMVVVFGHAGNFDGAMSVIEQMPSSDYPAAWLALLGACKKWGNVELGKLAFDQVVQLDNGCTQAYVFMANIFAAAGMRRDAEQLEMMRLKYAPSKRQGDSIWVDASGDVHIFSFGDTGHCQIREINAKLEAIASELFRGGLCKSVDWVLSRGRKDMQCGHSDKLAIGCALLNTYHGETIHIINTTHICDECHVTISLISRAVKRKIMGRQCMLDSGFMTRYAKSDGTYGRMDSLWKSYYRDPTLWSDNRRVKISPKFPDFKHKITSDSLWIDGWCNPFWVQEETRRQELWSSSNDDAKGMYDKNIISGIHQEEFIFMALLKDCAQRRDPDKAIRLHNDILSRGLLEKNPYIASTLISVYSKCGMLGKAQQVLEDLPMRNVVTWSALIAGYAQQGLGHEGLNCFEQMQREGITPNTITFTSVLKACGTTGSLEKGVQIHEEILSKGLMGNDSVLGTALVDMYAKCGQLVKAQRVLEDLPRRNIVSWSALLAGFAQQGQGQEALDCLDRMLSEGFSPNAVTYVCILKACGSIGAIDKAKQIHDQIVSKGLLKDKVLATTLVDVYAKCGQLLKAKQVLKELSVRDVASWNALICGYAQQGRGNEALDCYDQMKSEGLSPNAVTFISILKACCNADALEKGKQIHGEILNMGMLNDHSLIGNALINMYAKCGSLMKAQQVFKDLAFQDAASWNALIYGYARQGQCHEAMYCFEQMLNEGVSANIVTLICLLKICGIEGAIDEGKQIHGEILSMGLLDRNVVLGTALIDMYAKFGMLLKAKEILRGLPHRNVISWNALIAGYSQQGQGSEALNCLQWMQSEGILPNSTTLLCVLSSCYRSGLLDGAQMIFETMANEYGVIPTLEHQSCMIAGFGCAGHFDKAILLIKMLPSFGFVAIWLAVLSGCKKWGNVKLGMLAFCQAIELDNTCSTAYVLMNDIFAASGMQRDARTIEAMRMKNCKLKKMS